MQCTTDTDNEGGQQRMKAEDTGTNLQRDDDHQCSDEAKQSGHHRGDEGGPKERALQIQGEQSAPGGNQGEITAQQCPRDQQPAGGHLAYRVSVEHHC